jgi:HSP20 family molecular chaperone IbpA
MNPLGLSTIPFGSDMGTDIWRNTPLEDFMRPSALTTPAVTQGLMNVDLIEGINNYTLFCDVPGVLESDIDMSYDADFLTIRARRAPTVVGTKHRSEREFGNLQRRLRLPADCDKDSAKATYLKHGTYIQKHIFFGFCVAHYELSYYYFFTSMYDV